MLNTIKKNLSCDTVVRQKTLNFTEHLNEFYFYLDSIQCTLHSPVSRLGLQQLLKEIQISDRGIFK